MPRGLFGVLDATPTATDNDGEDGNGRAPTGSHNVSSSKPHWMGASYLFVKTGVPPSRAAGLAWRDLFDSRFEAMWVDEVFPVVVDRDQSRVSIEFRLVGFDRGSPLNKTS